MVTVDATVRVPKDVMFREVGGEAVILSVGTGKYYGLDEVGTRMWFLLNQRGSVRAAHAALLEEYDATPAQLQDDLVKLVDDLASRGLLYVDSR